MVEIKSWRQKGVLDGFVAMLIYYTADMFVIPHSLLLFYQMSLILNINFSSGGRGWFMFPFQTVSLHFKTTDLFPPAFLSRLSLAVASVTWLWPQQQPQILQIQGLKQQRSYYANLSLAGGGWVLRIGRLYLQGSVFKSCQFQSGCTPCKQCTTRGRTSSNHAPSWSDLARSKPSIPIMSHRQRPISTSMS